MTDPITEVDGGGVQLGEPDELDTAGKDNSPLLDGPPEESSAESDDKADKDNVGMSTPDASE